VRRRFGACVQRKNVAERPPKNVSAPTRWSEHAVPHVESKCIMRRAARARCFECGTTTSTIKKRLHFHHFRGTKSTVFTVASTPTGGGDRIHTKSGNRLKTSSHVLRDNVCKLRSESDVGFVLHHFCTTVQRVPCAPNTSHRSKRTPRVPPFGSVRRRGAFFSAAAVAAAAAAAAGAAAAAAGAAAAAAGASGATAAAGDAGAAPAGDAGAAAAAGAAGAAVDTNAGTRAEEARRGTATAATGAARLIAPHPTPSLPSSSSSSLHTCSHGHSHRHSARHHHRHHHHRARASRSALT
jgi:hypothetical protein